MTIDLTGKRAIVTGASRGLGAAIKARIVARKIWWESPVDDNAFLLLTTESGRAAQLHASWTEWKNLFSFEIFGTQGKIEISGLGGSYGPETLTHYSMPPQLGPPMQYDTVWHTPDDSFETEWREFVRDIREDREPSPGIRDAQAVLRVVEAVYGKP